MNEQTVIDLVASYENALKMYDEDRTTYYWGDFGNYVTKDGADETLINKRFNEALKLLEVSEDKYEKYIKQAGNRRTVEDELRQKYVTQKQDEVRNDSYEIVTIFDQPVLFTSLRIPRDFVPDGLYCYDIRHDDECGGRMTELKDHVLVNHWGTVLSAKPFEPREFDGHIYSSEQGIVIEDDDYNYTGDEMTASEYINRYDEIEQEYSEQNESMGMEMT